MRHGKKVNHLGRTHSHRAAMLSNMACSLIEHKRITTTVAKAKALRTYVEPLITKSKDDSTHSRRTAFSYLKSKEAVTELFRGVAAKVADRPGGYTRIIRTGYRLGDNAEMCIIELVDFNELMLNDAPKKATTRRSRRGGSASSTTAKTTAPAEETAEVVEEKAPEAAVAEETPEAAEEVKAEEAPETEAPAENNETTDEASAEESEEK